MRKLYSAEKFQIGHVSARPNGYTYAFGSPVTAKELDSGVDVMHRCFTEGGDSIQGIFSWELLRVKLQHK